MERGEESRPIFYSPFATACLPGINFQEGVAIKMQMAANELGSMGQERIWD